MEIPTFEELYAEHSARIWGLVFTMLRRAGTPDRAMADDLTQDVWLKVYLHPPRQADNLLSWLGIIAKFTVLDTIRHNRMVARHSAGQTLEELAYCLFDDREIDDALFSESVELAWKTLRPKYQQVLALTAQGYTLVQICALTGCTYENMKTRLWRARIAFRRAYATS